MKEKNNNLKIYLSTFYGYCPNNFTTSKKKIYLCHIREEGKQLKTNKQEGLQ